MKKLKEYIQGNDRWKPLEEFVNRILAYRDIQLPLCLENTKAIIDSICKEICKSKNHEITKSTPSSQDLISNALIAMGHNLDKSSRLLSGLISVAQSIGELRNVYGQTVHGADMESLQKEYSETELLEKEIAIESTETIALLLIKTFDTSLNYTPNLPIIYHDNSDFNESLDEIWGSFTVSKFNYKASEILYNCDIDAYKEELKQFDPIEYNSDEG